MTFEHYWNDIQRSELRRQGFNEKLIEIIKPVAENAWNAGYNLGQEQPKDDWSDQPGYQEI